MIRSYFRKISLALAATAMVSTASAAVFQYQFKTFYDGSTINPVDTNIFSDSVATLQVEDLAGGGVKVSLKFKDTSLPDVASTDANGKLTIDRLWLAGPTGTVAGQSGDSFRSLNYSSSGAALPDDSYERRSMLIDYDTAFYEGETSTFTITGSGITAASILSKTPVLEIDKVGGSQATWTAQSLRFVGGNAPIPEPATYALMGLGLVGMVLVSRRRKQAM